MLALNRTLPTLTAEEQYLSSLIPIPPRASPRPTDQQSGELKGSALRAFAALSIADEEEDIPFASVPADTKPSLPSVLNPNTHLPPSAGESTMPSSNSNTADALFMRLRPTSPSSLSSSAMRQGTNVCKP